MLAAAEALLLADARLTESVSFLATQPQEQVATSMPVLAESPCPWKQSHWRGRTCAGPVGEAAAWERPQVPTALAATQGGAAVAAEVEAGGRAWTVTAVSMGNPHAVVYSCSGGPIKAPAPSPRPGVPPALECPQPSLALVRMLQQWAAANRHTSLLDGSCGSAAGLQGCLMSTLLPVPHWLGKVLAV